MKCLAAKIHKWPVMVLRFLYLTKGWHLGVISDVERKLIRFFIRLAGTYRNITLV